MRWPHERFVARCDFFCARMFSQTMDMTRVCPLDGIPWRHHAHEQSAPDLPGWVADILALFVLLGRDPELRIADHAFPHAWSLLGIPAFVRPRRALRAEEFARLVRLSAPYHSYMSRAGAIPDRRTLRTLQGRGIPLAPFRGRV